MKTICLFFEIHKYFHLKRYRFFDIDHDHYYYDDFANETHMNDVCEHSYRPTLDTLLEMIEKSNKSFKFCLSISGVGLEQMELYAPDIIQKIQNLVSTGCVELVAEPYAHSLSSIINEDTFRDEVKRQVKKLKEVFGQQPKVLRNTNMLYSDDIGSIAADMGFKCMLTEGAKHILGWKSPHYIYNCNVAPSLKLLLRDIKLSDDISLRFSNSEWENYPLFASTYMDWIAAYPPEEQIFNIFMNMDALGMSQPLSSNILEFFKALPECAKERGITFSKPSEIIGRSKSVGPIEVQSPMSWSDEERDVSSWLGNNMQREAFNKLYSVAERVRLCSNFGIKQDFDYLQASNHLRFMTTKNCGVGINRGLYESPFDAFTNYMNVLGDFLKRVSSLYPEDIDNEELNPLLITIKNQGDEINELNDKLKIIEKKNEKLSNSLKKMQEKTKEVQTEPETKMPKEKKKITKKKTKK